ncbi:uncharacterized protein LOC125058019 isoform X1 [Pieris napi]|uniref:uncharacterized protein LOC125058019 isoform X1 n=2 Tax=Pieris napi TaxID=78633 RepID=UPI001FB8898A|nr:uncharacterized protein LOC125058019 isoform X1 [Pieris napi]
MNKIILENLMLDKISDKDNICVKPMHQMYAHQIDGVRFLFKKWKNKLSDYCVLSFPPQQGKSVTVLLFLYAVRTHLSYPILILCKDDEEMLKWTLNLKKWTRYSGDDIAIDPKKALINKQIFIKKYSDVSKLGPFFRRTWSIVVIKTDDCVSLPLFHRVEFTIWLTSSDLTKNVSLLKSMHNWIMPKVEFEMHTEILPKWKNEILKHSMLESFVLIRTPTSLNCQENASLESSRERKRLKNKDATGLKSKRTKKSTHDNSRDVAHEEMDVEIFIRNEKPVRTLRQQFDEEYDFDIEDNANVTERVEVLKNNVIHAEVMESTLHESIKGTNNVIESGHPVEEINKNATDCDTNKIIDEEVQNSNSAVDIGYSCDILKENSEMSTESNISDIKNDDLTYDLEAATNHPIKESINHDTESDTIEKIQDVFKVPEEIEKSEVVTEHAHDILQENCEISECNTSDLKHEKSSELEANVASTKNKSFTYDSDLDTKLNEMQEKAMKKFKGSLLDSIF